jgi:hypothetical protein
MFVYVGKQTRDSDSHEGVCSECGGQLGRDGLNCAQKRVDCPGEALRVLRMTALPYLVWA